MAEEGGIWKTFAEYDRRYVYLILFLVVVIPLLNPIGMPITVSPDTRRYHEAVTQYGDGDIVFFTFNTEFSGYNEIQSGIIATMRIFIENNCKIVVAVGHPEATGIPELVFHELHNEMEENGYEYGEDYIILGYIMPNEASVAALAQDFQGTVNQDWLGVPIAGTFLDEVETWEDIDLIADFTTGLATTFLLNHFAERGTPMVVNCIGVMIPSQKNYVDTGKYLGLLQSMRGGAELEFLTGHPGPGLTAMDAFTFGHYMLIGFIIIGNLGYFMYTRNKVGGR
jgi:hypothetical protein